MKRWSYVIFALICMFIPLITHAECDYQRQAELSRLASNVQFTYTYDLSEGIVFKLYITNLTKDIYVIDEFGNHFSGVGEKSFVYSSSDVSGFQNGQRVGFEIYSNDSGCRNNVLMKKYVNFPKFNNYSNFKECKLYSNFKYCQIWVDTSSIKYEQFKDELDEYLDVSKIKKENFKPSLWDEFVNFVTKPYVLIGGLVCIITLGVLFILNFIHNKRR